MAYNPQGAFYRWSPDDLGSFVNFNYEFNHSVKIRRYESSLSSQDCSISPFMKPWTKQQFTREYLSSSRLDSIGLAAPVSTVTSSPTAAMFPVMP